METIIRILISHTVILCQLLALLVIISGILKAMIIYTKNILSHAQGKVFQESRLAMGYSFSLGLSFLIGGSILKTTIAPTWNDIGRLAAIIALRTAINHFLLQAINGDLQKNLLLDNQGTDFKGKVVSTDNNLVNQVVN